MGLWTIGRQFDRASGAWITNENLVVTRTPPSESKHCRGEAFDIAFITEGKYNEMNPKNECNRRAWLSLAHLGETFGLKPGAFWSKPDYPHYEI